MNDKINNKINTAMESLNGIIPAEPTPFLATRIFALLRRAPAANVWQRVSAYIKKPAVAVCSVMLLLFLNIALFSSPGFSILKQSAAKRIASSNKYDFAINAEGIYDTENQEP